MNEKAWRPLRNGEYPPPGPTKLGGHPLDPMRPILVYADPLPVAFLRDRDLGDENEERT